MDLSVGEKIEVTFEGNAYVSQVQDIYDGERYFIAVPVSHGYNVFIPLGEMLNIRFFRPNGVYEFYGVVDLKESNGNVDGLVVRRISEIMRIQRREYYRLQMVKDVKYKRGDEESYRSGILKDLSGGGLRMVADLELEIGDVIDILLPLGGKELNLKGKVIRCNRVEKGFDLGVCFINIKGSEREQIIKFIFESQRKRIRKG